MKPNLLNTALEQLGASADLVSTKSALQLICSEFGIVRRLDVLLGSRGDDHQALCFLRMDTAEQEQQVIRFLEINRFAGDLVMAVDLSASPVPHHAKGRPSLHSVATS